MVKKGLILLGAMALATSAFAHDHFLYTDNLDVTGKKAVNMKLILGHPAEGKEMGTVNVSTFKGKTSLPNEFFVVHNGQKKDIKKLAKIGKVINPLGITPTIDATYTTKDGLRGGGSWVFFMDPTKTFDDGWTIDPTVKLIVTKDNMGSDYMKRVAPGHAEIVPLQNPVNAWKDNVFRAKFVGPNGEAMKNARVDIDFLNVRVNLSNDNYVPNDVLPKTSLRVFTDDNGVLAFVPSRAGKWVIRAIKVTDMEKQYVEDTSLVVQFD